MVVRCSNGAAFVVLETAPTVRSGIRVDIYDGANPATLLDTLPDTFARRWTDSLAGTGTGSFSVFELNPKLVEDATLLAPGNIARFILDGVARFALTIERRRYTQLKVGDDAARVLTVEGRGVLAKLEDALVYPAGGLTGAPERIFDTNAGETAETLLEEAQARGALAGITWDFTAAVDSNNAPWARPVDLTERAGTDVLRVVERLGEVAADVWITPALQLRMANTRGVNRALQTEDTGPVVLRAGYNVVELERGQDLAIRNTLLIETPAGFVERSEGASVTAYRRREASLSLGNVTAAAQVDRHAEAVFRRSANPADELTVEVLDVPGARPYVNWNVGDWVLAPNRVGGLVAYRVRAITVSETPDGRPVFVPELATRTQELEERLAAWLQSMARGTVGGTAAAIAEPVKASTEVVGAIDDAVADHLTDTLHVDELADLADVNLAGIVSDDLLQYAAPNWVARSPAEVAADIDLDDLGDVQAPTPSDGQVLTWYTTGGYWRPETPAAGPGGGGTVYPLDEPPGSPSAYDDEFDAGTLDPKWAAITSNAGNEVDASIVGPGWLVIEPDAAGSASTGRRVFGLRQDAPAGSFEVAAKVATNHVGNDVRSGLFVAVGPAGKAHVLSGWENGAANYVANALGVTTYSETADWSGFDGFNVQDSRDVRAAFRWYRIRWDAATSTLAFDYSDNGVTWRELTTRAAMTQPTRFGVTQYNNSAAQPADAQLIVEWFRVTT